MTTRSSGLIFAALFVLSGCMVGPVHNKARLEKSVPIAQAMQPGSDMVWAAAQPSAHEPRGEWWKDFGDEELNRLETELNQSNPTISAGISRIAEARALVVSARSDLFPRVQSSPSVARQRTSVNSFDRGGAAGVTHTYSYYTLPLEAGWEPDLWGRVKQSANAASARLDAIADEQQAVKLSLQAELAGEYLSLRSLDSEIGLLREMVSAFARSLELTRNRKTGGIATDLDVARAESQLRGAEAQIPALSRRREAAVHAVAVLCGRNPLDFRLEPRSQKAEIRVPVPALLESTLLERRPDVAAAERRVAAASAEVGLARTAFYPRFRIHGLAGLQSIDAGTLFNASSRIWSVGPSLEFPVFTGGRNKAAFEAAVSRLRIETEDYRRIALNAFKELADHLNGARSLQDQLKTEKLAAAAAGRALELANNRYRAGLVTFLEVATAQGDALARERSVRQLEGEMQANSVMLVKALGGGWTTSGSQQTSGGRQN